jgi:transcription elongation factor GreA
MSDSATQYLSQDKYTALEQELRELKEHKIPAIAKRIDDAKQMGDLSENAEYHSAREDMSWAQTRLMEVQRILDNSELISKSAQHFGTIGIGSTIVVNTNGVKKEFTIVGPQEASPLTGKISNESPLGSAFLGKKIGDKVSIDVPAGKQEFQILEVR